MTINLLDYDAERLSQLMVQLGEKPFRAKQLMKWIHQRGVADFDAMSDIAKSFRQKLAVNAHITPPAMMAEQQAKDGTRKWLLDVGTGTGVLAIAAARALKRHVAAGDIDPVSTATSRQNAMANRAGAYVRPVTAVGVVHRDLMDRAPYDLIFANILAKPLRLLAPSLARVASSDARLILSGLLAKDVAGVLTAYRGQGFSLMERIDIEGWAALILRRKGAAARPLLNLVD